MLITYLFSKNIKTQITLPYQWLYITFNAKRCNSSSTFDSSSDSDSESDLDFDSFNKNSNKKFKSINYLHTTKKFQRKKEIEKRLTKAADLLTKVSEKEKKEILSQLLNSISSIQHEDSNMLPNSNEYQNMDKKQNMIKYGKQKNKYSPTKNKSEIKYQAQEEPFISKMLRNQEKIIKGDDKFRKELQIQEAPSIIGMLQKQQRKPRDVAESTSKYDTLEEPSIIGMLQKQQRKPRDVAESTSKYDTLEEPSIIRMLKNKKETVTGANKIKRKRQIQEDSSITEMLLNQQRERDIAKSTSKYDISEPSIIKELKNQEKIMKDADKLKRKYQKHEPSVYKIIENKQIKILDTELKTDNSVIRSLIQQNRSKRYEEIFNNEFLKVPDVPELKIWNACEEKELQLLVTRYPQNAFQEMIKWTEEGKLWKFPIDNEQGMEEEHNVHFSKHVFLDRHLTWCPKGPILHFMELVCVGLSKNPYLTFEEKYDHIMWYKDYFKDKNDLLQKLGLVE